MKDDLAALDDYVSGHMSDEDAAAFEEALFADPDGSDAAFLADLARLAALLVEHGTWNSGATWAEVERILARGNVAYVDYDVPGEKVVPRSAEQVVYKSSVPLEGVDRIDLEFVVPGHGVFKTLRDVPFDPADGALYIVCEAVLNEIAGRVSAISRLIGYRGDERFTIGEGPAGVGVTEG